MAQRIQQFPSAYPMGYQNPMQANIEAVGNMLKQVKGAINENFNAQLTKTLLENANKPQKWEVTALQAEAAIEAENDNHAEAITLLQEAADLEKAEKMKGINLKPSFLQTVIGKTPNIENLKLLTNTEKEIDRTLKTYQNILKVLEKPTPKTGRKTIPSDYNGLINDARNVAYDAKGYLDTALETFNWEGHDAPQDATIKTYASHGRPWEEVEAIIREKNPHAELDELEMAYEDLVAANEDLKNLRISRRAIVPIYNSATGKLE